MSIKKMCCTTSNSHRATGSVVLLDAPETSLAPINLVSVAALCGRTNANKTLGGYP
ncbi:hypothetical protein [Ruegeria profundi]|uniref:hypothetical protein n=1 Tax=Ruegeria profundi TaxID=1685378 RepID=UPI000A5E2C6E|nr:hypothetical protein [Ruegeria profundi]